MNWREVARARRAAIRRAVLFAAAAAVLVVAVIFFARAYHSPAPFAVALAVLIGAFAAIENRTRRYYEDHDLFVERRLAERRSGRDRRAVPRPDAPDRRSGLDRREPPRPTAP